MNCTRCRKNKIVNKCDICPDYLCVKCSKIHTKHQECFIQRQSKLCYLCDIEGVYDYGAKKFICVYHI